MSKNSNNEVTGWVGWVAFAGIMMMLLGSFQAIAGLVALFKNEVVYIGLENTWLVDFTAWGWAHLILGIVIIFAGMAVLAGKTWGRVVGVLLASISALANFAFIPVYPVWSVLMIIVDALVIYALIVHGSEMSE
ncbi:hypothetical protein KA025_00020 [Candidatus Saccharibacteria bacterium]|nr:hypothetical protein [Candidatus Saccharibacteria bacterium]MBP7834457.1 hypothetical protein [Candidatus Saccharibacteria bacterium]